MKLDTYLNFDGDRRAAFEFWTRRYGITVDRFGVPWMVNCEQAA